MSALTAAPEAGAVGLILGLLTAMAMTLASWALRRLGNARDRELSAATELESVVTTVGHMRKDLKRVEGLINSQTDSLRALTETVNRESRSAAIEAAQMRATIDTHIATPNAHGGRPDDGAIGGSRSDSV